jgi:hypothetical protein
MIFYQMLTVPIVQKWLEDLRYGHRCKQGTAPDWYSLLIGALRPCGFLPQNVGSLRKLRQSVVAPVVAPVKILYAARCRSVPHAVYMQAVTYKQFMS